MKNNKFNLYDLYTIIICGLILVLYHFQFYIFTTILIVTSSIIYSFISAYKCRNKIILILNFCKKFKIVFYIVYTSIFFLLSALVKKYYNLKYNIEVDYLSYSISVLATLLSIIVPIIISTFLFNFIFFLKFLFNKSKKNSFNALIYCVASASIMFLFFYVASILEKVNIYFLWLDSYYSSDCNPNQNSKQSFIRKNNSSCYCFIYENNKLSLKTIEVKKP